MTDSQSNVTVVKVGGSLFAEPGAVGLLGEWLDATRVPGACRLLIAGGGPSVDALRVIDRANPLSDEAAHWAAIHVMDANAALLADWLPGATLTDWPNGEPGDWSLACGRWLREAEPSAPGERLRVDWRTTSDAIAARVAVATAADLVVVKHTLEKTYTGLTDAAADGVLDPETPRIARGLRSVELVGLVQAPPRGR